MLTEVDLASLGVACLDTKGFRHALFLGRKLLVELVVFSLEKFVI